MTKRLCVWNLSPETTREDLHSLFGQVARVVSINVPTQPDHDDQSMGLGFVEIETGDLAGVIEKVHITDLNGRTIQVRESLPSRIAIQRVGKQSGHQGDVNVPVRRPERRPARGAAGGRPDPTLRRLW
jgi:RNA recognition motif-containing protein